MIVSAAFYRSVEYAYRMGVDVVFSPAPPLPKQFDEIHSTSGTASRYSRSPGANAWIRTGRDGRLSLYWNLHENANNEQSACWFLHEVSHLLDGIDPELSHEVHGPILALDYFAVAKFNPSRKLAWMNGFDLGPETGGGWRFTSPHQRTQALHRSLREAVRRKLLTKTGEPIYRRELPA